MNLPNRDTDNNENLKRLAYQGLIQTELKKNTYTGGIFYQPVKAPLCKPVSPCTHRCIRKEAGSRKKSPAKRRVFERNVPGENAIHLKPMHLNAFQWPEYIIILASRMHVRIYACAIHSF